MGFSDKQICDILFPMLIVLAILSLGLLALIIRFAVSSKSSRLLKRAALIALVLILVSIGICAIVLVIGPGEDQEANGFLAFQEAVPVAAGESRLTEVLVFIVIFLAFLGFVIFLARRDQQRKQGPGKRANDSTIFTNKDDLDEMPEVDKTNEKEPDDDFDIKLE